MSTKSVIKNYEEFIIKNSTSVASAETLLQTMCSFAPGRFGSNEKTTEGFYAAVNLISLYHDTILWKHEQSKPQREVATPGSRPKRVVPRWWRFFAIILGSIKATELFIEVLSRNHNSSNDTRRWNTILGVESFRALIRLLFLYMSRGSILAPNTVPLRDKTPKLDGPANARPEQPAPIPVNRNRETLLDRARTQLPYRSGSKDWNSYWIKQSHADRSDAYIPTCPTNYRTLGEILYIVRPLVYVMAVRKWGREAWKPWLLSLLVDYLANQLSLSQKQVNPDEAEELARRKMTWFLYLVRSPFYEKVTCTIVRAIVPNFIQRRSAFVGNLVDGYRELYFYTSGSS